MTTQQQNNQLQKTLTQILEQSMDQISLLVKNQTKISELSDGILNPTKEMDFRSAITLVYMTGLNTGILEKVSLGLIFELLDKGVIVESMLNLQISMMYQKK